MFEIFDGVAIISVSNTDLAVMFFARMPSIELSSVFGFLCLCEENSRDFGMRLVNFERWSKLDLKEVREESIGYISPRFDDDCREFPDLNHIFEPGSRYLSDVEGGEQFLKMLREDDGGHEYIKNFLHDGLMEGISMLEERHQGGKENHER